MTSQEDVLDCHDDDDGDDASGMKKRRKWKGKRGLY